MLFGAVLNPARKIEEELLSFRYFAKKNKDGWGIGWYEGVYPVVYKKPENALTDPYYLRIARIVRSKIVIAHLRKKTKGNKRFVNTHPFSIGNYLFAHNGTLDKRRLEEMLKGKYKKMEGDTDSERLFHFLIQSMEKYGAVHGIRRALKGIDRKVKKGEMYASSVNFLLSNGDYLFAFAGWYRKNARRIYYMMDELYPAVYFASFPPFREEEWKMFRNGELVIVEWENMEVKRTRIG